MPFLPLQVLSPSLQGRPWSVDLALLQLCHVLLTRCCASLPAALPAAAQFCVAATQHEVAAVSSAARAVLAAAGQHVVGQLRLEDALQRHLFALPRTLKR